MPARSRKLRRRNRLSPQMRSRGSCPGGRASPWTACLRRRRTSSSAWRRRSTVASWARSLLSAPSHAPSDALALVFDRHAAQLPPLSSQAPPALARRSWLKRWRSTTMGPRSPWCAWTCPSTWRRTQSLVWWVLLQATLATMRAASSRRQCGGGRIRSCSSTRLRRRTLTCSTHYSRCSRMGASPTAKVAPSIFPTRSSSSPPTWAARPSSNLFPRIGLAEVGSPRLTWTRASLCASTARQARATIPNQLRAGSSPTMNASPRWSRTR
mmetsp:Transcript_20946/g.56426  ORF Transcript_20946/g.56426 Transcript_20946/m.56426 type:complete len:268 (+) Transcript_20946:174-977(+)